MAQMAAMKPIAEVGMHINSIGCDYIEFVNNEIKLPKKGELDERAAAMDSYEAGINAAPAFLKEIPRTSDLYTPIPNWSDGSL